MQTPIGAKSAFVLTFTLLAQSQLLNQRVIAAEFLFLQILKQLAALTGKANKAPARVKVLCVDFQVLGQLGDPAREQGYLHFARPGIRCVGFELLDRW